MLISGCTKLTLLQEKFIIKFGGNSVRYKKNMLCTLKIITEGIERVEGLL